MLHDFDSNHDSDDRENDKEDDEADPSLLARRPRRCNSLVRVLQTVYNQSVRT